MAGTVYINPTARAGGNGSQAKPYNSWSQVNFSAGTTYLQAAGTTYTGNLYIAVRATATTSIKIGSYGTGAAPVIKGMVNFDGATFASFSGFTVTNSTGAGVVVQNGANDVTIAGNTINSSAMGIWIGNAAGTTNTIQGNTITGSATDGIAVCDVTGSGSVIANNLITNSGSHGIELDGNGFTVEGNTVANNGLTVSGSSGIHVYSASATDSYGNNNVISGNVTINNHDTTGQDGNGIELDQWTHNNTVSNNFCYGNDGAGIVLYDSYNNLITANTVGGNELNSGGSHSRMAELVLNESFDLTSNNTVSDNVLIGASANSPAVFVDGPSSTSGNNFIANVLENLGGGSIYDWNGAIGSSLSFWQQAAGSTDQFSGVPLTAPPAGITPSFLFPTGLIVPINGNSVTLIGWAPGYGLLGG